MLRGQRNGSPTAVNLGSQDRDRYIFKQLINYSHEAEWTPFQTHYYSENPVAQGIPTRDLCICNQEL
jgi:hypothetical protein